MATKEKLEYEDFVGLTEWEKVELVARAFKGRLQSLLRMSVIVFAWGLHRKLGISVYTRSSLISGNNTRIVFFTSEGVKLEVSKIY
jgi:hypothetical protein